jgi:transcription elongation factor GreA
MITAEHETVYLSKKGMKELKKEIASLERLLHHAQNELRELDRTDSREDRFERLGVQSRIEMITNEIMEKRARLDNAKLLPRKRDAFKVALGSVVDLMDKNGQMVRYTIVSSLEANPSDGRISINSPLGQSLVGRSIKETIEWSVGLRANQLKLMRIS